MATNIPPHNLSEVINASVAVIENPQITWQELMQYIPGPDFPTGGIIYGTDGIKEAYRNGRGIIKIRARVVIEKDKRTQRETIIVTELPTRSIKPSWSKRSPNLSEISISKVSVMCAMNRTGKACVWRLVSKRTRSPV
jgi:DNA gyrase/topoisomerase IV subunit A